ncbi:spermidine synthase [Pseudonocardia humida]|uniref:Spermidine synthase n=1 Tax=Pseudonocardia humida TaxID=2800819 RepID=A0ABT1AC41_9PSEU|nr:spermidine synthase [Pseudonocardia humida]MCO1660563.1 spermidine synthase [Pseudonocardia humida]
MSARFQELDWRATPLGELVLRRRWDPYFDREVHEIKLNDEFLMSSLFTVAEVELAALALAELAGDGLDVVVGGLGLGCTALTSLKSADVRSLLVVEALGEVIEWHARGLIPAGRELTADPRCTLVHGDFFAMLRSGSGLDPADPGRRFDAVLVDIDHSPRHLLHPGHADFYEPAGLRRVGDRLRPGGVFALWSNDPPDDAFLGVLGQVFTQVRADVVSFDNPLQERAATNTIYLARATATP